MVYWKTRFKVVAASIKDMHVLDIVLRLADLIDHRTPYFGFTLAFQGLSGILSLRRLRLLLSVVNRLTGDSQDLFALGTEDLLILCIACIRL
jgi:hypothetical protein